LAAFPRYNRRHTCCCSAVYGNWAELVSLCRFADSALVDCVSGNRSIFCGKRIRKINILPLLASESDQLILILPEPLFAQTGLSE